jgi:hypothetical protein
MTDPTYIVRRPKGWPDARVRVAPEVQEGGENESLSWKPWSIQLFADWKKEVSGQTL